MITRNRLTVILAIGLALTGGSNPLLAQRKFGIGARVSHMPMKTSGTNTDLGGLVGTVMASYTKDEKNVEVQATYSLKPRDSDRLSPSIQLGSLIMAWWPGASSPISPFLGGGVGVMHVDPVEFSCAPPLFCEWGPNFRHTTLMTLAGVGGVDISFGRMGFRADVRGHYPMGPRIDDDSEVARWDVGIGVRYLF